MCFQNAKIKSSVYPKKFTFCFDGKTFLCRRKQKQYMKKKKKELKKGKVTENKKWKKTFPFGKKNNEKNL